jgi:ABC transporter substrate binding protein
MVRPSLKRDIVAQQPAGVRRIGMLLNLSENDVESQRLVTAFRAGLAQLGWADGRNLRIDYRWAGGDVGRIRAFARELVELSPDIIVCYATPSVVALQQETRSIPIVFLSVTDPVGQGLVAMYRRQPFSHHRLSAPRSGASSSGPTLAVAAWAAGRAGCWFKPAGICSTVG